MCFCEIAFSLVSLFCCGQWCGPSRADMLEFLHAGSYWCRNCKQGWIFVRLGDGEFAGAFLSEGFADGVAVSEGAVVIAVDMPIGYPNALERRADGEARAMVKPLGSSVFPALHPEVLRASDWRTANNLWLGRTGKGITMQSFALGRKILEVGAVALTDRRIFEVHHQVAFRALAGLALSNKKQWNEHAELRELLRKAGIVLSVDLGDSGAAGADAVLDAGTAAWSARRIAEGTAGSLPDPPEVDENGREIAIR